MKKNALEKETRWLLEEKYRGKRIGKAEKDLKRLEAGEPIDYVIGWIDFLACRIDLSRRPFIPRPETEYWVERTIEHIKETHSNNQRAKMKGLDIFAGSGCIGIAMLKHIPFATVDFVEKEGTFLGQIEKNLKINEIDPQRYRIIQSDIFSHISQTYDCVLANPPYVAESRKERVQKSVFSWEPLHAVLGGKNGLSYIAEFLQQTPKFLKPQGKVYMEFDSFQKRNIEKILQKNGYVQWEFYRDQYGKWRYLAAG